MVVRAGTLSGSPGASSLTQMPSILASSRCMWTMRRLALNTKSASVGVGCHVFRSRLGRTIRRYRAVDYGNKAYTEGNPAGPIRHRKNDYGITPDFACRNPNGNMMRWSLLSTAGSVTAGSRPPTIRTPTVGELCCGLSSTDEIINGGLPNQIRAASSNSLLPCGWSGRKCQAGIMIAILSCSIEWAVCFTNLETDRPHV